MITVICSHCGREFRTYPCRIRVGGGKYCSLDCYSTTRDSEIAERGKPYTFKKGHKQSPETIRKRIIGATGPNHTSWKGESVGYRGLHYWIIRQKGKASKCSSCGSEKSVQWANIDHNYLRDPDDYIEMCSPCHKNYDIKMKSQ